MPSDDGALNEPLDERLAEARNALLEDGENVVAQEMGDPGQAVVLTDSRVMILKSGLTATGEFNGNRAGVYLLTDINAVNVRKGPMGAVIQICTDTQEHPSPPGAPDNVIVFGGSQRFKRCVAIAAQIEVAIGKPVAKTQPGKVSASARSKAEQAVAEQTAPSVEAEIEDDTEESVEYRPNPNLPRPHKQQSGAASRALVLLAVLAAMLLVGLAVTSPIRNQARQPDTDDKPVKAARSAAEIEDQLAGLEKYRSEAVGIARQADVAAAKLEAAARSGNRQAIAQALRVDDIENLWTRAGSMPAPMGLAGAKESMVAGLGGLRATAIALAGSAQSQGSSPDEAALRKIASDRELVRRGLREIDSAIARIKAELNDH